ncbi:MAG: hypothetical protein Q9191_007423 [Dirinaria sp. TL-2023a]
MQGFNMGRYVPPEHEGTTSANKLAGKHALGSRARKSAQGILTVRFEMPFAIWCLTCPKPTIIGQGVRFNAEKKKVGNYHSTPIFSFRMKHNVCGGPIEIRTDPKNTAYLVTEGAKKRDTGEDKEAEDGQISVRTEEERARLQNDAFAALEVKVDDKRQQSTDKSRIEELQTVKEKDWDDPYAASKKLRRVFRADRKLRQEKEKGTEALKDRMSLGLDILEETEADRSRAGLVDFGAMDAQTAAMRAKAKPLFGQISEGKLHTGSNIKNTTGNENTKRAGVRLVQELGKNTRDTIDPFLSEVKTTGPMGADKTIFKRRDYTSAAAPLAVDSSNEETPQKIIPLVDYDSD